MRYGFAFGLAASIGLLFLVPAAADAADALARIEQTKTVRIATDAGLRPIAFSDSSGTLTGLDVEIGKEIARRLGAEASFVTPGWTDIVGGDWAGRWDMAVAAMTPTPERSERFDFPAIYRMTGATFLVRADNPNRKVPRGVTGLRLGVLADSTYHRYVNGELTFQPGDKPVVPVMRDAVAVPYADDAQAIADLAGANPKRLDAVITDISVAFAAVDSGVPVALTDHLLFMEPLAIAVEKSQQPLGERIAAAVGAMHKDGTISALTTKWLGMDLAP